MGNSGARVVVVSGSAGTVVVGTSEDVPVESSEEHEPINKLTVSTMMGRRIPRKFMVANYNCQL